MRRGGGKPERGRKSGEGLGSEGARGSKRARGEQIEGGRGQNSAKQALTRKHKNGASK